MHLVGSVVVTLGLLTAGARADGVPPRTATIGRGYVAAGGVVGEDRYERLGLAAEVGVRLGPTPFFVHALAGVGGSHQFLARTSYQTLRAGLEGRRCFSSDLCAYAGLDLGFVYESIDESGLYAPRDPMETRGTVVVPRAGLEHGTTWRVRLGVEVPVYKDDTETDSWADEPGTVGAALQVAVGYAF